MHLHRLIAALASFLVLSAGAIGPAAAQAPESIDGELVVVPVFLPGVIAVDGDLGDWSGVPAVVTTNGPAPSPDPAVNGEMRWQVAATTQDVVHLAVTITDDQIIAGQNGVNYWNEDSIEFYLNFADPASTQFGDTRISQVRLSAVDIGNTDPTALTLTGNGVDLVDVAGFVFETNNGWGLEIAVNVDEFTDVVDGGQFGVQIHANGSSGGDRDLKVIWSNADVNDTSFEDPSVFGTGQFLLDESAVVASEPDDVVAEPLDESDVAESEPAAITEEPTVVDTTAAEGERPDTEPEPRQTLFYAAVISAASVILGGLWIERWRKRSEAKLAEEEHESDDVDVDDVDDDEFREIVASILDE